jgi:hypothetical protein
MNIQSIANEILTQDNRSTAQPYLILLQTKRWYVVPSEYEYKKTEYRYLPDTEMIFDSFEEMQKDLFDGGYIDGHSELEEDTHYEIIYSNYYWETENVFFTESGYAAHVAMNKHNLGEYRSYGICAWRNPEMKIIMGAIQDQGFLYGMKEAAAKEVTDESKYSLRAVERILELPMRSLEDPDTLKLPETQALLKLISCMPWLLDVAEAKFDPIQVKRILMIEGIKLGVMDDDNRKKV